MRKVITNKIKQIFARIWVIMLMAIFSNKVLARYLQTEYGVMQTKYGVLQPLYGVEPIITPTITPTLTPPLDQPLYGVPQPLYGVPIDTITPGLTPTPTPTPIPTNYPTVTSTPPDFNFTPQILYGVPNPPLTEYWTAERILATIILPLVVFIVLVVGIIIYIKRKKKK